MFTLVIRLYLCSLMNLKLPYKMQSAFMQALVILITELWKTPPMVDILGSMELWCLSHNHKVLLRGTPEPLEQTFCAVSTLVYIKFSEAHCKPFSRFILLLTDLQWRSKLLKSCV